MSVAEFIPGGKTSSGDYAAYITRPGDADKISFFNLEHLDSEDLDEARVNAIAYASARQDVELAKNKKGRTHYRMILSYPDKVSSNVAVEQTQRFLEENLPDVRAVIAVHQDTDNTHPHVWIDARKTGGEKIHLNIHQVERISDAWTEQYDEIYGTNYAPEYKAKKEEKKRLKSKKPNGGESSSGEKNLSDDNGTTSSSESVNHERQFQLLPLAGDAAVENNFDHSYWREKEISKKYGLKSESTAAPASATEPSETNWKQKPPQRKIKHAAPEEEPVVYEQIKKAVLNAVKANKKQKTEELPAEKIPVEKPAAIDFVDELKKQDVFFNPNIQKSDKIVGVSFAKFNSDGKPISFKGSDLGDAFKWSEIAEKIGYVPERDAKTFRAAKAEYKLATMSKTPVLLEVEKANLAVSDISKISKVTEPVKDIKPLIDVAPGNKDLEVVERDKPNREFTAVVAVQRDEVIKEDVKYPVISAAKDNDSRQNSESIEISEKTESSVKIEPIDRVNTFVLKAANKERQESARPVVLVVETPPHSVTPQLLWATESRKLPESDNSVEIAKERRTVLLKEVLQMSLNVVVKQSKEFGFKPADLEVLENFGDRAMSDAGIQKSNPVQEDILNQLQEDVPEMERISVKEKSSIEAIHTILTIADESEREEILTKVLLSYEHKDAGETISQPAEEMQAEEMFANSDVRNKREREVVTIQDENLGAAEDDENRFGANSAITQTTSRFTETPERAFERTERESESPIESRRDAVKTSAGKIPLSATAIESNDWSAAASPTNFEPSKGSQSGFNENESQHVVSHLLLALRDNNAGNSAKEFDIQQDTQEQFYAGQSRGNQTEEDPTLGGLPEGFGRIENFRTTNVELFEMPPMVICQPQFALNTQAFVDDFMKMIQENCEKQNRQLSERAEFILKNQLRDDALIDSQGAALAAAAVIPVNPIETFGQTNQQVVQMENAARENTSKLEDDYNRIAALTNDSNRTYELNKIAVDVGQRANEEREQGIDEQCYEDEMQREMEISLE